MLYTHIPTLISIPISLAGAIRGLVVISVLSMIILFPPVPVSFAQECFIPLPVTVTVDLEPSSDINMQSEDHTVTATVTGTPAGSSVAFEVSGANTAAGTSPIVGGEATFTYTGINQGDDLITATVDETRCEDIFEVHYTGVDTATKHWTMFVIPESPIGIIALMASSLAALGGFMFWKRRNHSAEGMTGLGI